MTGTVKDFAKEENSEKIKESLEKGAKKNHHLTR